MRDIIEILRPSQDDGRSIREIARIVDVSRTTVGEIVRRASLAGVSYPVPADWATGKMRSMKSWSRLYLRRTLDL
ncbi:helix-turn-helix domain-containing protein [Noviherbaspirillum sedimenti]|nr:helix-turn-helix domain-containing protein [Noviherbaspirillum sedimenti]